MKFVSLYRVELRRLLLSRTVFAAALLSMLSLPLGNILFVYSNSRAMSDYYILTSVLTGTTVGAISWAVVMIMEADRLQRSGVHVLTDAISPPVFLSAARTLALLTISMLATVLTALVYLPTLPPKCPTYFQQAFIMQIL